MVETEKGVCVYIYLHLEKVRILVPQVFGFYSYPPSQRQLLLEDLLWG